MKDLNTNLLRYHQREQLQNEINQAEEMVKHAKPEEKGTIHANINRTKRQLYSQSPEPLTPKEKDKLSQLEKKLREKITTNMPTAEAMRKNAPGAVDHHMKWEKANKKAVRIWKNIMIQLNPDNSDKDLSNIERYRPEGTLDRMRSDAQITGQMSYGNIPDELWPFDAPQNTALEQAKKREFNDQDAEQAVESVIAEVDEAEAEATLTAGVDTEKKELSPEQVAVLRDRLAKARAAKAKKAEEARQVEEALEV